MEIMRYTLWRDLVSEKLILSVSKPNKRLKNLKNYPFACKVQKSFCGELNHDILENLRSEYEVVFA